MVERVDLNALACGTGLGSVLRASRSTSEEGGLGTHLEVKSLHLELGRWNALTSTRWLATQVSEAPWGQVAPPCPADGLTGYLNPAACARRRSGGASPRVAQDECGRFQRGLPVSAVLGFGPVWRGTCGARAFSFCTAAWMDICSDSAGERRFSTSLSEAASALVRATKVLAAGASISLRSASSQNSLSQPAGHPRFCQSFWASNEISSCVGVLIVYDFSPHAGDKLWGLTPIGGEAVSVPY